MNRCERADRSITTDRQDNGRSGDSAIRSYQPFVGFNGKGGMSCKQDLDARTRWREFHDFHPVVGAEVACRGLGEIRDAGPCSFDRPTVPRSCVSKSPVSKMVPTHVFRLSSPQNANSSGKTGVSAPRRPGCGGDGFSRTPIV